MIRMAKHLMTGMASNKTQTVLGHRADGRPSVTVAAVARGYWCFTDPEVVRSLISDLEIALKHLEGWNIAEMDNPEGGGV